LSILIIVKNYDDILKQISIELVERGKEITFLFKRYCNDISSLQNLGSTYVLNGKPSELSIDHEGWVKLIEETDRIITWS